LKYYPTASL